MEKPTHSTAPASGLTARSFAAGIVQVLIVCLGAPYAIWVLGSSEITWSFFPVGVGFPFLCLVLLNALAKKVRPSWAFRAQELITVAVMGSREPKRAVVP